MNVISLEATVFCHVIPPGDVPRGRIDICCLRFLGVDRATFYHVISPGDVPRGQIDSCCLVSFPYLLSVIKEE